MKTTAQTLTNAQLLTTWHRINEARRTWPEGSEERWRLWAMQMAAAKEMMRRDEGGRR